MVAAPAPVPAPVPVPVAHVTHATHVATVHVPKGHRPVVGPGFVAIKRGKW
jgi:hypothetical protein